MDVIGKHIPCVVGRIDVVPIPTHAKRLEGQRNLLLATGCERSGWKQDTGAIAVGVYGGVDEDEAADLPSDHCI